jgi:hypothetical protein
MTIFFSFPCRAGQSSWNIALMTNNADWKASRTQFHHTMSAEKTQQWHWKQLRAAYTFARSLLDDPASLFDHTRTYALNYTYVNDYLPFCSAIGSNILNVAYDLRVQSKDDQWINLAEQSNRFGSDTVNGGTYLVDALPIRA